MQHSKRSRSIGALRLLWLSACWSLIVVVTLVADAQAQRQFAPPPEIKRVTTSDGVELTLTYYASTDGKQATPIVMLPDYKDTRSVYGPFATRLQSPGEEDEYPSFAVVTVDLRGHGDSTRVVYPGGGDGELDAAKLSTDDFYDMVELDMEKVRGFLVEKNDAGELNLNKLCILGAGLGASVAVNWSAYDWSAPPLAVGKQGQDVKALVLVSPRWRYRGLAVQEALQVQPLKRFVAWMFVSGANDTDVGKDVRRYYRQLERYHPEPLAEQLDVTRSLLNLELDTSLQGGSLWSQMSRSFEDDIIDFLTEHVAEKEFRWTARRNRID